MTDSIYTRSSLSASESFVDPASSHDSQHELSECGSATPAFGASTGGRSSYQSTVYGSESVYYQKSSVREIPRAASTMSLATMISLATVTEPSSNESLDQATLINLSNPPPIPLTPTESEIIVRVKSSSSVGSDTSERENIEIIQDALVVGLDEMLPSAFRRGVIDTRGAEDCNESINVSNCPGLIGRVQDSSDEMDQVDNPGGYLRCPHQCNKSFDNAREWKAHALTHFRRERPPPTATCPFRACREKFESGNNHENWEARMNHVEKFHYAKQKNPISETDKDLSDLEEQDNDLIYWTVEYDPASSNHRARAGDGRISEPRAPEYPNFSSGQPHPADVQAGSSNTYYTCMRNTSTGRVREERRHS